MKAKNWRILSALIVLLAALTLFTSGCSKHTAKVTEPLSTQTEKQFVTESGKVLTADDLGLTEAEMRILKEKGTANVVSAEVASRIAGFKVAVPAYIPEGFRVGKFIVQLSGGGMPEELKPQFNNTRVNQYYTWSGEKYPMFLVTQSLHNFGISGSEPAEVCGHLGERTFIKGNLGDEPAYDHLALGWESDGVYYAIISVLGENLDEATLEKIACSVSINY